MGDRGNIAVLHSDKSQIWLYGHWSGYSMPGLLQVGLTKAKPRWKDESYATKIIFGHVVGDGWTEETGWGISGQLQDNEHPILVVDFPGQRVFVMPEADLDKGGKVPDDYKLKQPMRTKGFMAISAFDAAEIFCVEADKRKEGK